MKLLVFDIDGTILDSVDADDKCFIQTFFDLHDIDFNKVDWNDFEHVTDAGLTKEIFEKKFGRFPSEFEVQKIKSHFKDLLKEHTHNFSEINQAHDFIKMVEQEDDYELGFATGGWKETAVLKCKTIGLDLGNYIFKSSNDHFDRSRIIQLVIDEALLRNDMDGFESITYFGDGLWDYKSTIKLGIDFIGVDFNCKHKLQDAGVQKVIKSFAEVDRIMAWLK